MIMEAVDGIRTTGVCDCFVLVHDGSTVLMKVKHEHQETVCSEDYQLEKFATEQDRTDRIAELELLDLEEEEEEIRPPQR